MKQILFFVVGCLLLLAGTTGARAAFVTTNEAGMDSVFAQADIDVRFNPVVTMNNPSLLNIDTQQKIDDLFDLAEAGPTVFMFFVDTIDCCSSFNVAIIGCGQIDDNAFAVESGAAGTGIGIELNSHELGHVLGLTHVLFPNLMTGSINGNTDLLPGQISTIQGSQFVQDDGEMFVQITPVLITPIPPAGILFVSGLLGLYWMRRRQGGAIGSGKAAAA